MVSMALQQVQGIQTEKTLRTTSEVLFPSAQMSQIAEAAFHRAIENFSDAVLIQDSDGLRQAEEDGFNSPLNLRPLAPIRGLSTTPSTQILTPPASTHHF